MTLSQKYESNRPRIHSKCAECGNPFYAVEKEFRNGRRFCSIKCSMVRRTKKAKESFWGRCARNTETNCWEWSGAVGRPPTLPYGRFKLNGKEDKAHRWSWRFTFGEIPKDLWVLHKCDNPKCISPFHLFLGTPADNVHDCMKKGRRRKVKGTRLLNGTGEDHPNAKLTNETVKYIRENYRFGIRGFGTTNLGRKFGVSKQSVLAVVKNETWEND